jgi:uncharacterized protein YkwD
VRQAAAAALASILLAILATFGAAAYSPERAEAASTVRTCTGKDIRIAAAEKRMLALHNRERASRNLPRLCVHPRLQRAANAHSRKMIRRDRFSHGNTGRRLKRFGYDWNTYAENISRDNGRPSPERTFKGWMRSSSHRSNILNRKLDEVSIGAAFGDVRGSKVTAWTVDLAARR